MTVVSDYRALLSNLSWTSQSGAAIILTYSFSTAATTYLASSNPAAAATFHAATEDEKTTVRTALNAWASVSGVTFQEVTHTTGDITLGFYDLTSITGASGEAGLGNYPSTGAYVDSNGAPQVYSNFLPQGGDVYFDNAYQTNASYFSDFAHVAIHEIGHTLGLKHPFDTAAAGTTYTLDPSLDNGTETVMSYTGARSSTLGPLDVQAVQAIYGTKAGATHPFNEVWDPIAEALTVTGSATTAQDLFGSGGNDVFYSQGPRDALAGGEGDDLFYLAGRPASVNGGSGTDTVVTGLTYSALGTPVGNSGGGTRYVYLAAYNDFQKYVNVAFLDFTNGIYTTATSSFASFDAVVSPGTTNPDAYSWNAGAGGTWGTGAWLDGSTALTLLPPGANDAATITGTATAGAPATLGGIGNAASLTVKQYLSASGTFGVGSLAVGSGAGLAVASGGRVSVSGTASLVQTSGQVALAVGVGGAVQAATLSLSGSGGLAYALGTGTATVTAAGSLEVGTAGGAAAGVITVDAGRTVSGSGALGAAVVNNGTILATGGALAVSRGVSGTGSLQIAATGTLAVGAALSQAVAFTGTGGQLDLFNPAGTLQPGAVSGFASGDTIEVLSPTAATSASWNATTGVLSLANAGGAVAQVKLVGDYSSRSFQVATKAGGYADVTVAPANPLFDPAYYLAQNPDVAAAGANPLLHFEQYGWKEGRQPSLLFDDAKYLAANPDVKAAGIDPMEHYLQYGKAEGRLSFLTGGTAAADPLADATYYDRQLGATLIPTGAAGAQQAAWSYDAGGWQKGLNPDAWFDTNYYLSHNPDVAAAHVDPLLHYEQFGWKEGRDASAQFSTAKYLAAYADVRAAGIDPLLHFVVFGQNEGRTAFAA